MFPNVPCLYPRLIRQKCCQNSLMAESLFRVFDEDNSGALNFFEYLQVNTYLLEFELLNFCLRSRPGSPNVVRQLVSQLVS